MAVISFVMLALLSCGMINKEAEISINDKTQQDISYHQALVYPNISQISFFGKPVILDDSTHIMQQITEIVTRDTVLSIDGWVLTVGQVGFRINMINNNLSLISSTMVDDPKMEIVREYLNSIYGVLEEDEPDNYCWRIRGDEENLGKLIVRMRPFHSEEGGTVLIFEDKSLRKS